MLQADLEQLAAETQAAARGIEIRKVAGGYKMFTKAEHHEAIRQFVKTLRPKLRLSLPALETLAVIAYKQPVTVPEIQAIRGVNAGGVIHTLLNHKLITTAGRKKVIGRPMQYKTTKEFLVQFGLNDLSELPNLKELEELSRAALGEGRRAGATGPPRQEHSERERRRGPDATEVERGFEQRSRGLSTPRKTRRVNRTRQPDSAAAESRVARLTGPASLSGRPRARCRRARRTARAPRPTARTFPTKICAQGIRARGLARGGFLCSIR